MQVEYYSHGKLLLTGEYVVLLGAKALALPTRLGQKTIVKPSKIPSELNWNSYYKNEIWFTATFHSQSLEIINSTHAERALYIQELLNQIKNISRNKFIYNQLHFDHLLEFNPHWGLGSSSSLINNLAEWAKINPFDLLKTISKGSGYDIACANAQSPIFFQKTETVHHIEPISYHPTFSEHLAFVYLGKKMATESNINAFLKEKSNTTSAINEINDITNEVTVCTQLADFNKLMDKHEQIISKLLKLEPVKKFLFPDFPGSIKSLGAWGGDFVMVSSPDFEKKTLNYFLEKNYPIIFQYKDLVL